jgi:hypothetical protein
MVEKCPVCGKRIDEVCSESRACPNCGCDLHVEWAGDLEAPGVLRLPMRTSPSVEDDLKEGKRETYEVGEVGESVLFFSWDEKLAKRPFDRPFYTAMIGRACILINFSAASIAREEAVAEVLESAYSCELQLEPFLGGGYPVLRCNFLFPDDPRDPYVLESPLNICDGNAQDFCKSAVADEEVDLILGHERSRGMYAVSCRAEGLASTVSSAVHRLMKTFRSGATRADFDSSVAQMERVYPRALDGLKRHLMIKLVVTGAAKTALVKY